MGVFYCVKRECLQLPPCFDLSRMHSLVVVGTLQVFAVALTLALCTKQNDFVPGSSCAISKAVKVIQQLPSNYAEEDLECAFVKDKVTMLNRYLKVAKVMVFPH